MPREATALVVKAKDSLSLNVSTLFVKHRLLPVLTSAHARDISSTCPFQACFHVISLQQVRHVVRKVTLPPNFQIGFQPYVDSWNWLLVYARDLLSRLCVCAVAEDQLWVNAVLKHEKNYRWVTDVQEPREYCDRPLSVKFWRFFRTCARSISVVSEYIFLKCSVIFVCFRLGPVSKTYYFERTRKKIIPNFKDHEGSR